MAAAPGSGDSSMQTGAHVESPPPHIGTLNEGSLHAALKQRYARDGDLFEVPIEGFVIDLVRAAGQPDELLIEIQTGSFGALGPKLDRLLASRRMLIVHPIAIESVLYKPAASPRRSPKHGSIYSLFAELVSIPTLLDHPHFELEVVLARVGQHQRKNARGRRGRSSYRTVDRTLESVLRVHRFRCVHDLLELVPADLPETFTTADLAATGVVSRDEAQQLAYCLKACGLFEATERTRAGWHYRICVDPR